MHMSHLSGATDVWWHNFNPTGCGEGLGGGGGAKNQIEANAIGFHLPFLENKLLVLRCVFFYLTHFLKF